MLWFGVSSRNQLAIEALSDSGDFSPHQTEYHRHLIRWAASGLFTFDYDEGNRSFGHPLQGRRSRYRGSLTVRPGEILMFWVR